jgi:hypothetical protein
MKKKNIIRISLKNLTKKSRYQMNFFFILTFYALSLIDFVYADPAKFKIKTENIKTQTCQFPKIQLDDFCQTMGYVGSSQSGREEDECFVLCLKAGDSSLDPQVLKGIKFVDNLRHILSKSTEEDYGQCSLTDLAEVPPKIIQAENDEDFYDFNQLSKVTPENRCQLLAEKMKQSMGEKKLKEVFDEEICLQTQRFLLGENPGYYFDKNKNTADFEKIKKYTYFYPLINAAFLGNCESNLVKKTWFNKGDEKNTIEYYQTCLDFQRFFQTGKCHSEYCEAVSIGLNIIPEKKCQDIQNNNMLMLCFGFQFAFEEMNHILENPFSSNSKVNPQVSMEELLSKIYFKKREYILQKNHVDPSKIEKPQWEGNEHLESDDNLYSKTPTSGYLLREKILRDNLLSVFHEKVKDRTLSTFLTARYGEKNVREFENEWKSIESNENLYRIAELLIDPGIFLRLPNFLKWLKTRQDLLQNSSQNPWEIRWEYAKFLGFKSVYRSLSLNDESVKKILKTLLFSNCLYLKDGDATKIPQEVFAMNFLEGVSQRVKYTIPKEQDCLMSVSTNVENTIGVAKVFSDSPEKNQVYVFQIRISDLEIIPQSEIFHSQEIEQHLGRHILIRQNQGLQIIDIIKNINDIESFIPFGVSPDEFRLRKIDSLELLLINASF